MNHRCHENDQDRLIRIGESAYRSIQDHVALLEVDRDKGVEAILEDTLDLEVYGRKTNGRWIAERFVLLLSTGGPAVRITGELHDNQPCNPKLEVQDWGTEWTEYAHADKNELQKYCDVFLYDD